MPPPRWHPRSTLAEGEKGARRPLGIVHAHDRHPGVGIACGVSTAGLYAFLSTAWSPTMQGACAACIEAVALLRP